MLYAWLVFFIIAYCAYKDVKRTIIVWSVAKILFNNQVALSYAPGLALLVAGDVYLFGMYLGKCWRKEAAYGMNTEPFFLRNLVILMALSYVLSSIFGIAPLGKSFNETIKYFIGSLGSVFLLHKTLNTREDIQLFLKAAIICSLIITSLGIYEAIFHDNPYLDYIYMHSPHDASTRGRMFYTPPFLKGSGELQMRYGQVRCLSTFGIHIQFGCNCLFFLYLINNILKGTGNFIDRETKKLNFFSPKVIAVLVVMLVLGVLVSNSKTPIVGLVVIIFALYEPKKILNLKVMLPFGIMFVCLLIFVPEYFDNLLSIFDEDVSEEGDGGSSLEMRSRQLEVALDMFEMNPIFGNGVGSISYLKSKSLEFGDILGAESIWLRMLPERGIFGAIIYLYSFILIYNEFTKYVPVHEVFFLLLAILVMETATGSMHMAIWLGIFLAVRRIHVLESKGL